MPQAASASVDELLRTQPALWRGGALPDRATAHVPTGFDGLDAALPGRGWPQAGLIEVLHPQAGVGELRLLLPTLARLSQARRVVLVRPPMPPYAPALAQAGVRLDHLLWVAPESDRDTAWVLETALRSTACGMAIGWPGGLPPGAVRRLQVAATEGRSLGVLMRPDGRTAPNVNLRLRVHTDNDDQCVVQVDKARGSHRRPRVVLPC